MSATYRRRFSPAMVELLAAMWRHDRSEWMRLADIVGPGEVGLATWVARWYLVEQDPDRRGWWRITERGQLFLAGDLFIPPKVKVAGGKVVGHEGQITSLAELVDDPPVLRGLANLTGPDPTDFAGPGTLFSVMT